MNIDGLFTLMLRNDLFQMSWDWRKILEVLILGQFVIDKASNYFPELLVTS